jgi:hypothetical protein
MLIAARDQKSRAAAHLNNALPNEPTPFGVD